MRWSRGPADRRVLMRSWNTRMQGDFSMDGLVVDWRLDLMVTQEVTNRRRDGGRIADVQQGIWVQIMPSLKLVTENCIFMN